MADEKEPPQEPPPSAPPVMTPLTAETFLFPEGELKQWVEIPQNEPLFIGPLTRADLDRLLFSNARMAAAIRHLQHALIEFSNGRLDEANKAMVDSGNLNVESETEMRKLFYAIIQSVLKGRQNGSK